MQPIKLGILGGGQLGRMLLQAAANYTLETFVLDPDEQAPARYLCQHFTQGSFADFDTVYNFGKDLDVVTVEIEHVNVEALKKLQTAGVKVFPQPEVLELIQDKGTQKLFFQKHNIPTAPFELYRDREAAQKYAGSFPVMQKLCKLGYDGKGVKKISTQSDLATAFDAPSILEQFVSFEKELAVIVARGQDGKMITYPVVEMQFHPEANLVEWLLAPARVSTTVSQQAQSIAKQVAEGLQIVGVLAIEMFLTKTGGVVVNEIAPRPHNSGHQTIEANITSQYDQHLRAICGWPLGDTTTRSPAVMINLLGEVNHLDAASAIPGVFVHQYGKAVAKPMRKMGHITVLHNDVEEALRTALDLKTLVHNK